MSENDLRFDSSYRWSPSISVATSQTLSEVEEGTGDRRGGEAANNVKSNRKKTPPPPRPPPPKWEQFHRRRASHHTLFSSATTAPQPNPPSLHTHSSSYIPPLETSRQRSYSSPLERQNVSESCPRCSCSQAQTQDHRYTLPVADQNPPQMQQHSYSHTPSTQTELPFAVAPPSPMFSRKAFRPVALPQKENNLRNMYGDEQERVETLPSLPPPTENSRRR